jgi:hypothetical protein
MVGLALVKSMYAIPTWTRTVALVRDHAGLRNVLGAVPSADAAYRFTRKLRAHGDMLTACIDKVLAALHEAHPVMGQTIAIDGSDIPAYANGHKWIWKDGPLRTRYADPDASWGHRSAVSNRNSGSFYGYKLHALIDVATELPVAWTVATAKGNETPFVPGLLDTALARGFVPGVAVLDKGYDVTPIYEACETRDMRPVIPLRQTPDVKAGKHNPPECDHGTWTYAGSDTKRGASKWRCPTGECQPASMWVKASRLHTLIPRGTERWKALYRQRWSVERTFGRLKHEWGLTPLRVRRLARVQLHADLTILAQLAFALLTTWT